jgi:tetratricopeptide (TPR) repeat protein
MNQEVVLILVFGVALVCLVLGLAQAMTPPPRPRRAPARRPSRRGSRRRAGVPEAASPAAAVAPRAAPATGEPAPKRARAFTPRARPAEPSPAPPVEPTLGSAPSAPGATAPPAAEATAAPRAASSPAPAAPAAPPAAAPAPAPAAAAVAPPRAPAAPPPAAELPVAQCASLYERRQYQEVVRLAEPALQRALADGTSAAPRAEEVARLWSLLGLSRQALGDDEGARSALEEAIHVAPTADRPAYRAQLAALASSVSRRLLHTVEPAAEGAGEEQIRRLRQALVWIRQGLAEAPEDQELRGSLERTQRTLWTSYDGTVTGLLQRQEFKRAQRLIREALGEEDFPPDRRGHFQELLATTFTGEIGQLTASAIRTLEDGREREALAFLQRAEGILASTPVEILSPKRREEASRRLWWGYTKLGVRRVEGGQVEEALEPLFHALRIGEVDAERQGETREALVRALEGVVEARAQTITRLARDGNRTAAVQEVERLKTLMREGLERGLSQRELATALARARRIVEWLEQAPPA